MGSKPSADAHAIGQRLRAIRKAMGATLAEVGARTGVSVSALSKIENAQLSPSYDILKRLCDGLEIGLEDLVSSADKTSLSGRKTITRLGEGDQFQSDQYDYRVHASEISRKGMVPLEITIRARSTEEFDHWSQHGGEEFVYILSGCVEIHTEHYAPFRISQGESCYFDSSMKHVYISVGGEDARVVSISCEPGSSGPRPVAKYMNPASRALVDVGSE